MRAAEEKPIKAGPVLKIACVALLVLALAGALAMWFWPEGMTIDKLGQVEARNFYFAQPNHLSSLAEAAEVLEVRAKRIAPSLLERLEYRLGVRYNCEGEPHFTPFSSELPRRAFPEGNHCLLLGVRDRVTGQQKTLTLTSVTQPARVLTGISPEEAVRQVFPSPASVWARQVLGMAMYMLLGMATLLPWRKRLPLNWVLLLSYPVGICLWGVMGITILITHLPYSPTIMFSLTGAIILVGLRRSFLLGNLGQSELRRLGIFVPAFLLVSLASAMADFTVLLWDPWRYVIFGKHLAFYQSLFSGLDYARGYGIFLPLTISMGQFLDLDFFGGVQPLLYINCLAVLCYNLYSITAAHGVACSVRVVLIAAAVIMISCTSFFGGPGGMYWYLPNVWAGLFFFLAVVALGVWKEHPGDLTLGLVALFTTAFGLSRIEGPIMSMVIMLTMFVTKRPDYRDLRIFYLPFVLLNIAWYSTIWLLPHSDLPDFLSAQHLLLVIGSNLSLALLVYLSVRNTRIDLLMRQLARWAPRLLLIIALATCVLKPARMANNILSLTSNIFMEGAWGGIWFVICLVAFQARWLPPFRNQYIYGLPTTLIVLLALDILIVRVQPLYFHLMDSGNRMPLFYLFSVVFYLTCRFGCALGTTHIPAPPRWAWIIRLKWVRSRV